MLPFHPSLEAGASLGGRIAVVSSTSSNNTSFDDSSIFLHNLSCIHCISDVNTGAFIHLDWTASLLKEGMVNKLPGCAVVQNSWPRLNGAPQLHPRRTED